MTEKTPYAHYDPEVDALWLRLADGELADTEEVADNVMVSYDQSGKPLVVEIIGGVERIFAHLIAQVGSVPQKTGRG